MSWRYLPERVEDYLQANGCLDAMLFATPKSTDIARLFYRHVFKKTSSTMLPSGTTCDRSTANRGADWWISLLRDSLVSRLASRAECGRLKTTEISGRIRLGSLERCGLYGYFLKTSEVSGRSGSAMLLEYSASWPKRGMMRNGIVYQLPTAARPTKGNECGYWPTPTVTGNNNRKGMSAKSGDGLATAVKRFPTPLARDARTFAGNVPMPNHQGGRNLSQRVGGTLNPRWVEWLMGWPIGWVSLKPLETDRFRLWLRQHTGCSGSDSESEE